MFSRKALAACSLLVALLLLPAGPAAAQDPRGSITGTVADSTGGVLPGVTVTVKNVETGVEQTVVTDGEGRFQVLYLNPGTYTVTAELSGFKKIVRREHPRRRQRRRAASTLVLETGGVEETVDRDRRGAAAQHHQRHQRHDDRQQADRGAAARRRHRLHADAAGARASWTRRTCTSRVRPTTATWAASSPTACRAATSSRIDGAPNMSNAQGRGLLAAVGRHLGVQGADQRVRRRRPATPPAPS